VFIGRFNFTSAIRKRFGTHKTHQIDEIAGRPTATEKMNSSCTRGRTDGRFSLRNMTRYNLFFPLKIVFLLFSVNIKGVVVVEIFIIIISSSSSSSNSSKLIISISISIVVVVIIIVIIIIMVVVIIIIIHHQHHCIISLLATISVSSLKQCTDGRCVARDAAHIPL
jgi:hypothetical protein